MQVQGRGLHRQVWNGHLPCRCVTCEQHVADSLQDTSAEDALAQELQEAIAEARSHQSMAAQQRRPRPVDQVLPHRCHKYGFCTHYNKV